jgi:hypothetical protein
VVTEEGVGERVAGRDSDVSGEKDCAAEGDAATEGGADVDKAEEGDAVEVPQAVAAKEDVSRALYEGPAVSMGDLDSLAEAENPDGVTSGDEVAERETSVVAERVGEDVLGGEAVDERELTATVADKVGVRDAAMEEL